LSTGFFKSGEDDKNIEIKSEQAVMTGIKSKKMALIHTYRVCFAGFYPQQGKTAGVKENAGPVEYPWGI